MKKIFNFFIITLLKSAIIIAIIALAMGVFVATQPSECMQIREPFGSMGWIAQTIKVFAFGFAATFASLIWIVAHLIGGICLIKLIIGLIKSIVSEKESS